MTTPDKPTPFALPSCPYCHATITAHQKYNPGHCGSAPCIVARVEEGQQKLSDEREQFYADRQAVVLAQAKGKIASAASQIGVDPNGLKIAVVPFQNEPLAPLKDQDRDAFEAHLKTAVHDAFAEKDDSTILHNYRQKMAPEPEIVDAGCAACQGFCCKRGGGDNHAFITRQSIYAIRQSKPELAEEDVVAHFMDALPSESVTGACVFQGDKGCTLTREWRAGLCNTFLCHDLFGMHDLTEGRLDVPLVIAGINDDEVGSTVLYEHGEPFTTL